jgi:hypothetical protein
MVPSPPPVPPPAGELALLVAAWPRLPAAIKAGILAMVEAAGALRA